MISRPRTTFWRYNLALEGAGLLLASIILYLAVGITLTEMSRQYLELRGADAARVHLFLENHLEGAREGLEAFTELPESERSARVLALFTVFSDIYRLDQRWRVERIYKASPDTKVFVGFSFSLGKLGEYLSALGERAGFSQVMRGYEDDAPSVYIATGATDGLYLMRLNLGYVENFLIQFSRFSGTPAMLVANDGFVMLSGDPRLKIMALDLKNWSDAPSPHRTLSAGGRHWIPIVSTTSAIGGRILTLIPTELLTSQRNALLVFVLSFTCVADRPGRCDQAPPGAPQPGWQRGQVHQGWDGEAAGRDGR